MAESSAPRSFGSRLLLLWGVGGVICILLVAVVRLAGKAWVACLLPWDAIHWAFLAVWLPFMAYSEGYRGFQKRFSPVVVARAWHLASHPRLVLVAFGPLFCMGFFHGSRRRLLTSWILTFAILLFVLGARQLDPLWRGLVDMGVVVGLCWGM
ncbi:MAG TPA: hypothetical protein DIU15_07570, partial [Deltaproteobacteria bacterium]|nr:hypothetical protein [Deltaproteobacteria bacterium]